MKTHLLNGDVMTIPLADQSVHCIVTSPPYWGLRSYLTGDNKALELGSEPLHDCGGWVTGDDCGACFVCNVRQYAREFWRVLRDDGTWFLNLGDSYNGSGGAGGDYNKGGLKEGQPRFNGRNVSQLKPKDLCGIPWRVALALQADGWFLRSDIIWAKPNPMPESVTDRPTKAHEYLFLLSKNKRYFYDADAVREEPTVTPKSNGEYGGKSWHNHSNDNVAGQSQYKDMPRVTHPAGRNRRTVWNIATAPYSGAHFATFPPALVEPCIKAGTSERGCCPVCGKQWVRVTKSEGGTIGESWHNHENDQQRGHRGGDNGNKAAELWSTYKRTTLGFRPDCDCKVVYQHIDRGTGDHLGDELITPEPVPSIILDPFAGSGTTVMVANQLGRRGVGLDLSLEYLQLARERVGLAAQDAWQNGIDGTGEIELGPLFAKI